MTACLSQDYSGTDVSRAIALLRKTSKLFPNSGAWDYRIGFASEPFPMASTNVSRIEIAVMRKLLGQEWSFMFAK